MEDAVAAAAWYRRAASNGHYPAQARLGFLLANGIGTGKDRAEAFVWLSLAAQHGVGTALKALEEVGGQMSLEEKRRATALLSQWRGRLGMPTTCGWTRCWDERRARWRSRPERRR